MDPKTLIKDGRLTEARAALIESVKNKPTDAGARSLLFQVLLFLGEWDKARRHLEIAASQSPVPDPTVEVYKNLIQAEKERIDVWTLKKRPDFFPEVPHYVDMFFDALANIANGAFDEAHTQLETVAAALPTIRGKMNGIPFNGFMDTDPAVSCFIEAIEYERYVWVPISNIRELVVSPPKTLIDLIWAKGHITTWEGLTMGCFLPVMYPFSFKNDDDRIRSGRMTDWKPLGDKLCRAVGQRVFQVGDQDIGILELGEVVFILADD
ncbi:MAG: tetratricopeptide repeat protein [Desulfosarcina sp.]|nr:tetratricopeptide repeat protein [Desulfosarcina sp.]